MNEAPPVGTLLQATIGPDRYPLARMGRMSPIAAAREALAVYLECAVFLVEGTPDARWRLNAVRRDWPEDFQELKFPAAAITVGAVINDAHNLMPSILEETAHQFGRGTVLWKTAENAIEFVVDFWLTNKPERESAETGLQELFNPTETRAGIMVQGPADYYERTIRYTLVSLEPVDTSDSVFARERQLRAVVKADIDVVQLRKVAELTPVLTLDGDPIAVGRKR